MLASAKRSREDTFQLKIAGQIHMNLEFDENPVKLALKKSEGKQPVHQVSLTAANLYIEVMDKIGKEHIPEKLIHRVIYVPITFLFIVRSHMDLIVFQYFL